MFDDDSDFSSFEEEFEDRQCRGITLKGERCKITAQGCYYSNYSLQEAADSLQWGDYCGYHIDQQYHDSDGDDFLDDEEEEESDSDGKDSKDPSRFRVKAGSEPDFIGYPHDEYKLIVGTGKRLPRVAKSTTLPSWVMAKRTWQADHDPHLPALKCFNGFIVHMKSDSVVGYMSGYLIKRQPGVIRDCDDLSQETIDFLTDMFDFGHRGDTGDLWLKDEYKRVGRCTWGGRLDAGRFALLERLELGPVHRGKGVLGKLANPLLRFCDQHSIASVFALPGFLHEPAIDTPAALARNTGNIAKLGEGFSKLGFRPVGTEGWMAMVADRQHPCWCPSTYQSPEFPFREVAKTAGNGRSMIPILQKCIAARRAENPEFPDMMRRRGYKADNRDDDELLAAATAALDAIKAHDPTALFVPAEKKNHAGPARLLVQLLCEESAWKAHKLAPGIRRMHLALMDFYQ